MRIRIITDDFTSALDGTACFAQTGWDTAVLTRPGSASPAAVVSLDTDTRERPGSAGANPVTAAALAWRDAGLLVLQFDSTLRGRVAADCLAACAASTRGRLLIAPAFPSAGRTTEAGCVRVDGVPVHETAFSRDPTWPVAESSVPALFAAHGTAVRIARDPQEAARLLESPGAVVVDAHREEDLDALAASFAGRPDLLWAGSTGLLRALARTLPAPVTPALVPAGKAAVHPWLVAGSFNPRARRQLAVVQSLRQPSILATSSERLPPQAAVEALDAVVQQAAAAVRSGACDGLVVTGGATARRLVDALPALSLRVCREVLPGVPLAQVLTTRGTVPMITKAGGFGGDDALVTCLDALSLPDPGGTPVRLP